MFLEFCSLLLEQSISKITKAKYSAQFNLLPANAVTHPFLSFQGDGKEGSRFAKHLRYSFDCTSTERLHVY
jgi:hypothetical protein